MNDSTLQNVALSLGLEKYRRHIFLCADQTEPKCAPKEKGLGSWEFLKARLKELDLVGPEPLVYRSKVNCLRVCIEGPIAELLPGTRVVGGMCFICSNKAGPGHIRSANGMQVSLALSIYRCRAAS